MLHDGVHRGDLHGEQQVSPTEFVVAPVVRVEVSHTFFCLRSADSFVRACSVTVLLSAHDCTLATAEGETPYWNFGISG